MLTFDEARKTILETVPVLSGESVSVANAAGRVLCEEIRAPYPLPPFDNSAMDGYAVRTVDCTGSATLPISDYRAAGDGTPSRVDPGQAVKIMTGSPIPVGCDAIVPFEDATEIDGRILVGFPVKPGAHIRRRGEDIPSGTVVFSPGTVLRPPDVGMLASLGFLSVRVGRRPRVAVVSTGDELVEPGQPLGPGQIVNSNSVALCAAIAEAGAEPVPIGIARDDEESLREKLSAGLGYDAMVTTAGVSAGDRDLVRSVLESLGARLVFWKVAVKPGGPTAFSMKGTTPVFSLPGNPVSTLLTFETYVRPALRKMAGESTPLRPFLPARLSVAVRKKAGKMNLLRIHIVNEGGHLVATPTGDQNTGIQRTLLASAALAILDADRTDFAAGDEVPVLLLYPSFNRSI